LKIGAVIEELWGVKCEVEGGVRDLVKKLMNSLWGRSIGTIKKVTKKKILRQSLEEFIRRKPLLYSYQDVDEKHTQVQTIRPILSPWNIPQFGVNVMSWARKGIQEIVYEVIDAGEQVYYANTDCVMIKSGMRGLIHEGTGLGEFKLEDEFVRFICIGAKTRLMVLKGGGVKNVFGQPSLEYFEEQAELMRKGQK
jgi:hypothetical protein